MIFNSVSQKFFVPVQLLNCPSINNAENGFLPHRTSPSSICLVQENSCLRKSSLSEFRFARSGRTSPSSIFISKKATQNPYKNKSKARFGVCKEKLPDDPKAGLDVSRVQQSSDRSWLLSTDGYSSSWNKIEKLSDKQCQPETQLKFITEAWLQIIECRRVLKWTYAYGYYLPESDHAKRQFFEYLQGEAESGLERLHQCAEKELQTYLQADDPSEGFNDFKTKLAGLTSVTRNYFETLVRALENGLSDVDSQGVCSRTTSSKNGGVIKGRGGRGKGTTSRTTSTGLSRPQEDSAWDCEHCTFKNARGALIARCAIVPGECALTTPTIYKDDDCT